MFQLQQEETLCKQVSKVDKKLVLVLATSISITGTRKKVLEHVPYIHYPDQFKDIGEAQVQVLVDSKSKTNAIHLTFAK